MTKRRPTSAEARVAARFDAIDAAEGNGGAGHRDNGRSDGFHLAADALTRRTYACDYCGCYVEQASLATHRTRCQED